MNEKFITILFNIVYMNSGFEYFTNKIQLSILVFLKSLNHLIGQCQDCVGLGDVNTAPILAPCGSLYM